MTKKITRPKDWDRPGKRGQKAARTDLRAPGIFEQLAAMRAMDRRDEQ